MEAASNVADLIAFAVPSCNAGYAGYPRRSQQRLWKLHTSQVIRRGSLLTGANVRMDRHARSRMKPRESLVHVVCYPNEQVHCVKAVVIINDQSGIE